MKNINKSFIYSLPILFILGAISHFLYNTLGSNSFVGILFPVNESIYEHTKLGILPLVLFYIYGYYKYKPDLNRWFNTFVISFFTTILLMPFIYYFYTSSFGFESIIIDILIFFISITLGQLLALHYYNNGNKQIDTKILIIVMITYLILNIMFTFNPPRLPIFYDKLTNSYGLK